MTAQILLYILMTNVDGVLASTDPAFQLGGWHLAEVLHVTELIP